MLAPATRARASSWLSAICRSPAGSPAATSAARSRSTISSRSPRSGLLKAIDRFDADRDVAFSSFAVPTILGEIKRHFRDRTWSVRVPRDLQELALRVDRDGRGAVSGQASRADGRASSPRRSAPPRSRCSRRCGPRAPTRRLAGRAPSRAGRRGGVGGESGRRARRGGGGLRAGRGARDAGAAARAHLLPRTPGADAALRRGPDPGGDRRADRRLPDAGLPTDPPGAHPSARRPGRASATRVRSRQR